MLSSSKFLIVFRSFGRLNIMESFNMKKFRSIRQLVSSAACVILSAVVVFTNKSYSGHLLMQLLLTVLGVGVLYCVFGLTGLITGFIRNGFIKNNVVLNCVLDTFIYLALCVGAFFLVTFICDKVIWLGLLFALGGVFEVWRDIKYLVDLDDQRSYGSIDDNSAVESVVLK